MAFTIATWNVNSLKVRLPHVLDWLAQNQVDVLALQETKMQDPNFPVEEITAAGYQVVFSGQRAYNGVAILSRQPPTDIIVELPGPEDPQRRVLGATIGDIRVLNLYVPNGESITSPKYQYKLGWLSNLAAMVMNELKTHTKVIIVGDFNIAPADEDVHDPAEWLGRVLFSDAERTAFKALLDLGVVDCFRLRPQAEKSFSWWDYRLNSFKRNRGLRIDHILASKSLADQCTLCTIDKGPRGLERPSDHAPVLAEFNI
ncbi:MAG: exodeoxyribonuclease III [Pseudomonadota bacterium]